MHQKSAETSSLLYPKPGYGFEQTNDAINATG